MGRAPCCDKASVKKGPWSPEEDRKLKEYIDKYGTGGNWIALPHKAGLKRCGKSCRLRWLNYLRPNIKHGHFSDDEDRIICNLFASIGSRWSIIAAQLPGRTDNDIKNYWNTKLKKKLMGLPPTQRSKSMNHHKQQQLFFPAAAAPIFGDASTTTGTAAAAAPTPHDHPFSLQHLAAPHQYSSSSYNSSNCSSLLTASGGLLMFGGDQQQMVTSSSCSDNGGLYFELCNNSSGNSASVGLESIIFGGFDTMQNKLFPAGHNTNGASLLDHQLYIGSGSDNNNEAASCYEHEMKPFLVVPSGSTGLGLAAGGATSSLFYGEAGTATGGAAAGETHGRFLY